MPPQCRESAATVPRECRHSAARVPPQCRESAATVPRECRESAATMPVEFGCMTFRLLSLAVYWLIITSGSLLNEYRILQVFLLCFEVIGNDDSLSLAVCTCCLGNRLFAVFPRAFYGLLACCPSVLCL